MKLRKLKNSDFVVKRKAVIIAPRSLRKKVKQNELRIYETMMT